MTESNSIYLAEIAFPENYEKAVSALADMQYRIDKYKLQPDHNAAVVSVREKQHAEILEALNTALQAIGAIQSELSNEFKRGYQKGAENALKQVKSVTPFDREAMRSESINSFLKKWPELS